jgi:uncharacterized protein DUF6088
MLVNPLPADFIRALPFVRKGVHFSDKGTGPMSTIQDDILDPIRGQDRGKVFTPKDFLDLGSRDAADQSLSRLFRSGEIQRLGRGLYHYPRLNERLGIPIGADPGEIAEALGRHTGSRLLPSGAVAALLPPGRMQELRAQMLNAGLPL